MATSITTGFSIRLAAPATSTGHARPNRRRRITRQAGRALEILGHAIEYLTDEFIHSGAQMSPGKGELEAVQLLMALNRQVYFDCPEMITVVDRLRAAFNLRAA
jgi:hypothetical protein